METQTTHFGYKEIPLQEKQLKVKEVFSSVANKYDLMNDLMSLGIHRLWKRIAISKCALRKGQCILDLAGGTGDLTALIAEKVGREGRLILADLNREMLNNGKTRLLNSGIVHVEYLLANAESLPLPNNSVDLITIAFGLRNMSNKLKALSECYKILKPGGRLVILEFSYPVNHKLRMLYDAYSVNIMPLLGKLFANDEASYQYLVESIRMHPKQEALTQLLLEAGFDDCSYTNLTAGICAIHLGFKF